MHSPTTPRATAPRATPPSRNFSHPVRLTDVTPSPEHNQDNPPMAPNVSNMFLPRLPSAVLASRSEYNLHSQSNLHSERDPYADFDFSYHSPRRPGTAHTLTSRSVPDLTLTALPPPPLPPLTFQDQGQSQGLPPINLQPPSPKRLIKDSPRSPTKSTRGSRWRHVGRKIKRVFTFGRQGKRGSREMEGQGRPMEIGSPYGFQHVETHGVGPLRTGAQSGDAMTTGHLGLRNGGYGGQGGLGGPSGAVEVGGLGRLDVEGTAVEDDGASEWEDYVGDTTIFFQQGSQQGSNSRRA